MTEWVSCPRINIGNRINPTILREYCPKCYYWRDGRCAYKIMFNPMFGKVS